MKLSPRLDIADGMNAKLEMTRNRLMVVIFLFAAAFVFLGVRTLDLGLLQQVREVGSGRTGYATVMPARADIVDRNGVVLATNLDTASLHANPREILDANEAARLLVRVLPDLSEADLKAKLSSSAQFVWIKRKLTPRQKWKVNALGLPGLHFRIEEERIYPQGKMAAHVLGHVDVDGKGIAGVERFFDQRLSDPEFAQKPLQLSIDSRIQHALADEMMDTVERFSAKGAAGVVMDVNTGEVLAMVSLPDYDPNRAGTAIPDARFNRASKGVYELGSIFKTFTLAMALDGGVVDMNSSYDATYPIRVGRFQIRDDHPKSRVMSVPEIFTYSSNIGVAQMALDVGGEAQQEFLGQLGLLRAPVLELEEVGYPIYPDRWRDINTMTISYGHGIAVSPLQVASGMAAMVNGGSLIPATLIKNPDGAHADERARGRRIISDATSTQVNSLLRAAVKLGTGSNADVPGYRVGGKTGTAEKSAVGGYKEDALISSFVGVFPMDAPRYLVLVAFDEPKGIAATYNFASAGWVAAPAVGRVVGRIAPLLGVEPGNEEVNGFQQVSLLVEPD